MRLPTRCAILVLLGTALAEGVRAQDRGTPPKTAEILVKPNGDRVPGRLAPLDRGSLRFVPEVGETPIEVKPGMAILREPTSPNFDGPPATFRAILGYDQRISGRLVNLDERGVGFEFAGGKGPITLPRGGISALVQRDGEAQVLADDFDALDTARWTLLGTAEIDEEVHDSGSGSLKMPAGGASVTTKLAEAVAEGRLDLLYLDDGRVAAGHRWYVDLLFRGRAGDETIRVLLGWSEESLGVETPGGLALAVQRLARRPGWHRLSVRFGADRTGVAIDSDELVHGKGPTGPLIEIRIASSVDAGAAEAGPELASHVDGLRLVKITRPASRVELDPDQDEARLTGGDQLFGSVKRADLSKIAMDVGGQAIELTWAEAIGVYFRRIPSASRFVEGPVVLAQWNPGPGVSEDRDGPDRIEGALVASDDVSLTLETAYAGKVVIPREHLTRLDYRGTWAKRMIVDPFAHHLGDSPSDEEPRLDPPQPQGGVLERTIELERVPEGKAVLVLDVVQVVGETGSQFSSLLKEGELATEVWLNGRKFDTLNRHIKTSNETPERIRLEIPDGALIPGKNVVRFNQLALVRNPTYLDDLGVLTIALEFEGTPPADAPAPDAADGGRGRP